LLGRCHQFAQINVRTLIELGQNPSGVRLPRLAPATFRVGSDLALFATLLLDATNPRLRHPESQRDRSCSFPGVTRGKYVPPKLLRISFHNNLLVRVVV
jgi:hypothetical protein